MRSKRWIFIILMIGLLPFNVVHGSEVQQIETAGTIGFTGVYKPIGTPDPKPPESIVRPPITAIAKPGILPQTNEGQNSRLIWLGILLISLVFIIWRREIKQNTKTIRK